MNLLRRIRKSQAPFPESSIQSSPSSGSAEAASLAAVSGEVPGLVADAAERIDELVAVARHTAEAVAADASELAQASDNLINRERIAAELARTLAERTDGLRRDAEELAEILSRAIARFKAAGAMPPAPKRSRETKGRRSRRAGRSRRREGGERREGPRVLVAQMAAASADREEIAQRLRRDYDLSDPDAVIDDVIGSSRAG